MLTTPVLLGSPITTARLWVSALVPNTRGTWNYVAQSYELGDTRPAEWTIVKDLVKDPTVAKVYTPTGIFGRPPTSYPTQLRAANGRVFFPAYQNYFFYYEPEDESIHQLGPLVESPPTDPHASTQPYRTVFGPDGKLYGGTSESHSRSPMLFTLDPETLSLTILGYVGEDLNAPTTYAYYVVADTVTNSPYLYVVVGEDPWQLWAFDLSTLTGAKLAEVTASGNMEFTLRHEGIEITIDTNLGADNNVRTTYWCVDGQLYTFTFPYDASALPFTPRSCVPFANPVVDPPDLDDTLGAGAVKWRQGGGAWTEVTYVVNHTLPVAIESLTHLGDWVVGTVEQYNGRFRLRAHVDSVPTILRPGIGSQDVYAADSPDGRLWFTGYPNGTIYAHEPSASWSAGTGPTAYGEYFPTSDIKYPYFLIWAWGYLYCLGRRERSGVGCALGRWDPRTHSFVGMNDNLAALNPRGLLVTDQKEVVLSGTVISGTGPAQLVVYSLDLAERRRLTVQSGLMDTGRLYAVRNDAAVVGVVASGLVYRYDVQGEGQLLAATTMAPIGATCQDRTGTIWMQVGTNLIRLDPHTLVTTTVASLSTLGTVGYMTWVDERLYLAVSDKLWVISRVTP